MASLTNFVAGALLILPIVLWRPRPWTRFCRGVESRLARIARHRILAVALAGLWGFAVSAGWSLSLMPAPTAHDEFGYLLIADTLAHGRLTNPTHPLWAHFETFHILSRPSYAAKYPPGQGIVLALGRLVGGHPIVGVWIGVGMMSAAVCWMLQQWTRPRWALFGALVTATRLGQSYWGNSYWGGAVTAAGGALTIGAGRAACERARASDGLLLGLGVAILGYCRPFEGLLVCLPVAGMLAKHLYRLDPAPRRAWLARVAMPAAAVLGLAAAGLATYHVQVTGSPLRMPYQVYEEQYGIAPTWIIGQPERPAPRYQHALIEDYNKTTEMAQYRRHKTLAGFAASSAEKLHEWWWHYLGTALTIPMLALPWALGRSWTRFALGGLLVAMSGELCVKWGFPHYLAPATGFLAILQVEAFRRLALWQPRGCEVGRALGRASVALLIVLLIIKVGKHPWDVPRDGWRWPQERARIEAELGSQGGKHVILVRYEPKHKIDHEWVFNGADIDGSPVVWAREMGPARDAKLIEYFHDRRVWLLEADRPDFPLRPYRELVRTAPATERTRS